MLLETFLAKRRGKEHSRVLGESWRYGLFTVARMMRSALQDLRVQRPPPKKPPKTPRTGSPSGYEDFNYNALVLKNTMLGIAASFREQHVDVRKRRGELWGRINDWQPRLKVSDTVDGYLKQKGEFRQVQFRDELLSLDPSSAPPEIMKVRFGMFKQEAEPGMNLVPKRFSLMCMSPLAPAFVTCSDKSLKTYVNEVQDTDHKPPVTRLWWTQAFDFHTRRYEPRTKRVSRGKGRKVLRRSKLWRKGIPSLWSEAWLLDDSAYLEKMKDGTTPCPWFVNSLKTDGLQVKVTLKTLKTHQPLPHGIEELVKKGYEMQGDGDDEANATIKAPFKLGTHEKALHEERGAFVELASVDPGLVEVYTQARAKLHSGIVASDFTKNPGGYRQSKSAEEYRYYSLAKLAEKEEESARKNSDYGRACEAMMDTTLGSHEGTLAYVKKSMETLVARSRELMSEERLRASFARVRARGREIERMARDISGRDEIMKKASDAVESELRGKFRSVTAGSRRVVRVVLFGNGQFGHGGRGPCPRKALIRALGLRCPVVLVDEFNTSKMCCGCGSKLAQVGDSRVFRCKGQTDGDSSSCFVSDMDCIDRDINGAVNIGYAGALQLLGRSRPSYLERKTKK
ncbi:unnamed protein product [Chrysoparadoxa australica]